MKDLLTTFFKTSEERIKNPFIGAFMTSWLIFNWKPILFIISSLQKIEDKIVYIDKYFSNILNLLWLPLISAIFYILILPYLSLAIDHLLKFSQLKRTNLSIEKQKLTIESQKQLAIEEIKFEEAKTEFRERNTHNRLVENLQKKIKDIETEFENEKNKNSNLIEQLKSELSNRDSIYVKEIKNYENRYSEAREEIMKLNEKIYEKEKVISKLERNIMNEENLEKNTNRLFFENGLIIDERIDNKGIKHYKNVETGENISNIRVLNLMDSYNYNRLPK